MHIKLQSNTLEVWAFCKTIFNNWSQVVSRMILVTNLGFGGTGESELPSSENLRAGIQTGATGRTPLTHLPNRRNHIIQLRQAQKSVSSSPDSDPLLDMHEASRVYNAATRY